MNRRALQVVIGFILLVGLTAGVLIRVRANYVLGAPGVKLVNVPIYNEDTNIVSNISAYLPEEVGDLKSSRIEPVTVAEQMMLPPDTVYGRRSYSAPDKFKMMISIVVMGTDRTSIHKPQYCLIGQGEQITGSEVITIPIRAPYPYELKVMKLTTRSERNLGKGQRVPVHGAFLYWFLDDQHLTPHHEERMWLMARDLLTRGRLQRWAYVAYYSVCLPGQEEEMLERMKQFIAASVPEFQTVAGPRVNASASNENATATELAKN
jgi:hypothetical protein